MNPLTQALGWALLHLLWQATAVALDVSAASNEGTSFALKPGVSAFAILSAMAALRETGDALESIVPHELWPLATYREMLFIK